MKTNLQSFWVSTKLGFVQKQGGSLFLYMSYITLSRGPVLWSESELFTLMPSLPTTNCVQSPDDTTLSPAPKQELDLGLCYMLYLAFLYMTWSFCCLYFSTVCTPSFKYIRVCIHIYVYVCMHIYICI